MDILNVNFFSDALGKYSNLTAFLPRKRSSSRRRREYPVLYLLHGHSDDYSAWGRFSRIERYVQQHKIAVVTPDASTSFYINSPMGQFESHIIDDVIGFSEASFPLVGKRSGRAISGLSMGGFGSLLLGMKYPSKFCAISAHSSAVYPHEYINSRPKAAALYEAINARENSLDLLAKKLLKTRSKPAIRFDCGRDDFLYDHNVRFDAYLTKIGLAHEFHIYDGAHTWEYWDEHVSETFAFAKAAFKGK